MPIGGNISGGGGGGGEDSAWSVEAEIDFTTLAPHDFLAAGTPTDSATITAASGAVSWEAMCGPNNLDTYASTFEINASGLQIEAIANNSANTDYYGGVTRAPRLGPKIADIISNYDYYNDIVVIQAHITAGTALSDDFQAYGLTCDSHLASQDAWIAAQAKYFSSGRGVELITKTNEFYTLTNPADASFFELVVGPRIGVVEGAVSDWQGSFPEPRSALVADPGWSGLRGSSLIKPVEGPSPSMSPLEGSPDAADGYLSVMAQGPWSNTAFTMTCHKVRFLRLIK